MMSKKIALRYIVFLYLLILCLPMIGRQIDSEILIFLDQPVTILLPTLIISYVYRRNNDVEFCDYYRVHKVSFKNILLITGIVFLLPSMIGLVIDISFMIFPSASNGDEMLGVLTPLVSMSFGKRFFVFIYNLCFMAVFPGLCEEILFRGSIWHLSIKLTLNTWIIVILNAAMFSVFHWNLDQLLYTFVLGIIFALIAYQTNSILSSIYAHILYNFIVDLSMYFIPGESVVADATSYVVDELLAGPIMASVSTVLVIIILKLIKIPENKSTVER